MLGLSEWWVRYLSFLKDKREQLLKQNKQHFGGHISNFLCITYLHYITVAKLPSWSCNEVIVWLEWLQHEELYYGVTALGRLRASALGISFYPGWDLMRRNEICSFPNRKQNASHASLNSITPRHWHCQKGPTLPSLFYYLPEERSAEGMALCILRLQIKGHLGPSSYTVRGLMTRWLQCKGPAPSLESTNSSLKILIRHHIMQTYLAKDHQFSGDFGWPCCWWYTSGRAG